MLASASIALRRAIRRGILESCSVNPGAAQLSWGRRAAKAAIHKVSAWSSGPNMVLGQIKVIDKSNESTTC